MDNAREDDPSAVAIIFDGNPNYWEDDATLAGAIDAVLALLLTALGSPNAGGNGLLLVGEHPKKAQCLLPGKPGSRARGGGGAANFAARAGRQRFANDHAADAAGGSLVGGALALALCRLAAARARRCGCSCACSCCTRRSTCPANTCPR